MTKLIDHIKSLEFSLTIAWVILVKACIINPSYPDAIIFFCAVLNICHERYEVFKKSAKEDALLDQNITGIQNQIDLVRADHSSLLKVAEDAKKALTDLKLSQTFQRPKRQ